MRVQETTERCRIDSHVGRLAFAPNVRKALTRLGYTVVDVATHDTVRPPDLRIADDRHPGSLPSPALDPRTPIVLLTGIGRSIDDPRVVGRVRRPAELGDLYRIVQQAVEAHPRLAPRAETDLPARITKRGQSWAAELWTLSERGCMLHTREGLDQGDRIELEFSLPGAVPIGVGARVVWSRGQYVGLVFSETGPEYRTTIDSYVGDRLANTG